MRTVSIDTNVYSAFKRNDERIVFALQRIDTILVDITVLAELLCGFKQGMQEKRNREELEAFLNNRRVSVVDHDMATAEFYSNIFLSLKRKGKPIPVNDIWIAASAMRHGSALFTLDDHFGEIDGLLLKRDY